MNVYLVGSLRNNTIVSVAQHLTGAGLSVFSEWFSAGPEADDHWQKHQKALGRNYREALASPAAQNTFWFDVRHLRHADMVVQVMPSGKSASYELGFAAGLGKPTFILMDEPAKTDRWDVMTLFAGLPIREADIGQWRAPGVAYHIEELLVMIDACVQRMALDCVSDTTRAM